MHSYRWVKQGKVGLVLLLWVGDTGDGWTHALLQVGETGEGWTHALLQVGETWEGRECDRRSAHILLKTITGFFHGHFIADSEGLLPGFLGLLPRVPWLLPGERSMQRSIRSLLPRKP